MRGMLLKLQHDSLEPREVVRELEKKYPVEECTFQQECAFWNIQSSSQDESECRSDRDERYRRIPLQEASDPERWMALKHFDDEMENSPSYSYDEASQGDDQTVR